MFLTAALLPVLLQAGAPVARDRTCLDDGGVNRCLAEARDRQRALYEVPTAEDLAETGTPTVRVFFVDGYGVDVGLVTAQRPAGESPFIEASGPAGSSSAGVIRSPLTLRQWEDLLTSVRYADRELEPKARSGEPGIAVCLHSWINTLEIVDPDRTVRGRTQNACGDSLVTPAAFGLAELAVRSDPACDLLDRSLTRNAVTVLAACRTLAGDRLAAAEAWNVAAQHSFLSPQYQTIMALNHYFTDFELSTDDFVDDEPPNPAADWQSLVGKGRLRLLTVMGDGPDRVTITGEIDTLGADGDSDWRRQPVTMGWARTNGFGFRVTEVRQSNASEQPEL